MPRTAIPGPQVLGTLSLPVFFCLQDGEWTPNPATLPPCPMEPLGWAGLAFFLPLYPRLPPPSLRTVVMSPGDALTAPSPPAPPPAAGGRPNPLLVVGDDAAHEVGGGVAQRGHELPQLLLVQLPHRAEHALLGLGGAGQRALRHLGHLVQPHDSVHWGRGRGTWRAPSASGLPRAPFFSLLPMPPSSTR